MENAMKALLIGASLLFVVMVLSLVMMFYGEVSDYYQTESDITHQEQTLEFNKDFENYHREQIRGSDMISLMNRIIDYNTTQTYQAGTNYKRIEVTINLVSREAVNQFKYNTDRSSASIIDDIMNSGFEITNKANANLSVEQQRRKDYDLTGITGVENILLMELEELGVTNPNAGQLQTLASNIANLMVKDKSSPSDNWTIVSTEIMNRQRRADLISSTLNLEINFANKERAEADNRSQNIIKKVQEIALQYYQFTQFKRAYFDCTEVIYDADTGRISEMNFELRIDSNGNVEFN